MTSELCDSGADEQREMEAPAASKSSSVSPLSVSASLELPGPWSSPVSPVSVTTQGLAVHWPRLRSIDEQQVARQEAASRLQGSHTVTRSAEGIVALMLARRATAIVDTLFTRSSSSNFGGGKTPLHSPKYKKMTLFSLFLMFTRKSLSM